MIHHGPAEKKRLSTYESGLLALQHRQERRRLVRVDSRRAGEIQLAGRWLPNFTSNDYLGLACHPSCCLAACATIQELGVGSGSSLIVTGRLPPNERLELLLEQWVSMPRAVLFPSGYQANVGLVSALASPGDTVFSDEHNHASIVDGCRLSGARVVIFPHLDLDRLAATIPGTTGRRFIVTDTLFSMDGSLAPVAPLERLARQHNALLLVDEAHAIGILGPQGQGLCAAAGVRPDGIVGTFSKALGSHGAFVASEEVLAEWLVNRARSLIYTTALPPPVLAATLAALEIVRSPEGERLRARVLGLADVLRHRLIQAGHPVDGLGTPIVSLRFLDDRAVRVAQRVREAGFLIWAFRPPTVPPGFSRLRISLSAAHQESHVERLGDALLRELISCPPAPDQIASGQT